MIIFIPICFCLLAYILIGSWLAGNHPEPVEMLLKWPKFMWEDLYETFKSKVDKRT